MSTKFRSLLTPEQRQKLGPLGPGAGMGCGGRFGAGQIWVEAAPALAARCKCPTDNLHRVQHLQKAPDFRGLFCITAHYG